MQELVSFLEDVQAAAFVILGLAVGVGWLRRRDRSLGYLALAIILLSVVSGLARLQAYLPFQVPLFGQFSLLVFMGCAYALLLFRNSIIPLPRSWHVTGAVALVAASALYLLLTALTSNKTVLLVSALLLIFVWCAAVGEPIVRFWLVARDLPAVQAWRLRSLSLGFGGLVAILLFAISVGIFSHSPLVQVVVELVVIAIVPLLYASFSPPAWLRREWRASEEEGLRAFTEQLLLNEDRDALANRALEWAARLVGGASAVLYDTAGKSTSARGVDDRQAEMLAGHLPQLHRGVNRVTIDGAERTVLMLPVAGLAAPGTLVVLAGPFTPGFGDEELNRVQQFMSAVVTALDRRQLIVQLEHSNRALIEANRHKSVFLANMSHELRTPLNAIIGFSELLTDAREGQFDEATRKRFQSQILTSGKHLLGLINDILDLSKVEAGQMDLRMQTVSVPEIVDQVVKTVEPLVVKKSIQLEANVAHAGDILVDAGKLKQMLLNLVSNAIKFTPEGGKVTIAALRDKNTMEISVADTGIGIAEADQRHIFQEFHQIDQGPGRKHEGTGLGLALTRRFALLHGGEVRVHSRLNQGSVFTLVLPAEAPRPVAKPAPVPPANGHGATGPLVLVVEDDPAAAELMTRYLSGAGYRTEVASTGTQALAKAADLKPAAITLDIILPEVDGWEVMTKLKSDETTSSIPIVVASIVDNPELGIALGAIDYFVKPVDASTLIQRLNNLGVKRQGAQDKVRVLVVDDERINRDWLTKALEPAGFTVTEAAGGREGIELAKSMKPDLVLLDLMMPEVTGFDVVEALRADAATREMPIMVITAANLTEADKRQLNGRVANVLRRESVGASDIVGLLRRLVAQGNGRP
jgi:signal transduction histidine kinase/DNA-binding response OmpR family regulator